MNTNDGRKVKKVTTRRRQRAAGEQRVGPEHLLQPAADEADEGHHHDQRARRGLAERQAVDHLRAAEPLVLLDRALVDVGQHRVGAAEGQQRGLGEEPAHLRQRAVPALRARRAPPSPAPTAPRPTPSTLAKWPREKRACAGVGVSSSISAGAVALLRVAVSAAEREHLRRSAARRSGRSARPPARWPGTACRTRRSRRTPPPRCPTSSAFFSARVPMRCAACSTSAVTAGLMP